jgi:hypothetical protein
MFLNFLKNFLLKRKLKSSLSNVSSNFSEDKIQTVGILIDESYFNDRLGLISELIANNIQKDKIKVLVYKDKIKKNDVFDCPNFSLKNCNWIGDIDGVEVNDFVNRKFDLLISYYDIEKAALLNVTQRTKANFKVGFSTIDKRLNHFMIKTVAEDYQLFIAELFKYLKILNKI